jgi:hypothetical protein
MIDRVPVRERKTGFPMMRAAWWCLVPCLATIAAPAGAVAPVARLQFNRDIRPILADNCFPCHGPDKGQRKADLRLDLRADAVRAEAIVPGKPDESALVERIFSGDRSQMMPPPKSNKRLTAEQKTVLKRWVAQGADYQGHWAYIKPVKPSAPAGSAGIDVLVRRRLDRLGLRPSVEADRRVLARRLSFDLVGLPPRPADVDAFVADPSPDAYEKLVDRLLASPHFGERMALGWLDVVRFADSIGYHSDNPHNVWPYRDYVIRAFNENKPFDRFTIEQLAGDLLPGPTRDDRVASGFNRLLLTTEEGGAQPKDYEARMLADRVRAVGTVWLGQTLGCCQCHDHKFDPATTRDFYSMGAFFADVKEPILGRREPGLVLPTPEEATKLARLNDRVTDLDKELKAPHPELASALAAWEESALAEQDAGRWHMLRPDHLASEHGVPLTLDKDGSIRAERDPKGGVDTFKVSITAPLHGITGFRLEALADPALFSKGPGRGSNGNFVLTELQVLEDGKPVPLSRATASFEQPGYPAAAAIDGKREKGKGWAILGRIGADSALYVETASAVGQGSDTKLTFVLQQDFGDNHVLGRFRLSATTQPPPIRPPTHLPANVMKALRYAPAWRSAAERDLLRKHYESIAPALADLRHRFAEAKKEATAFEETLPHCLVSAALETPRTVRILPRGNFMDDSGPIVQPALPRYLAQEKEHDGRLTRLDLARWIVSRDNPLTARVFVNRLWRQFFGTGLTRTLDDLGTQGQWPANPELLDWLACDFIDQGWDVKHLVREIVTSRTYRQTSTPTREQLARDPDNRALSRQGRFRLDAELVRDNALQIAGLLVDRVGGPSAKPYQPAGYWENLNFPPRTYEADSGVGQYRRGLYVWRQRTFPHPSLLAFDAPTREECCAERGRSNIPQQALVLLNDPTYVEAARAFAARIVGEGGASADARIRWAWRQALAREPRPDELETTRSLLDKHLAQYADNPASARALLKVGQAPAPERSCAELAAWTSVARVILNLHETITRY